MNFFSVRNFQKYATERQEEILEEYQKHAGKKKLPDEQKEVNGGKSGEGEGNKDVDDNEEEEGVERLQISYLDIVKRCRREGLFEPNPQTTYRRRSR
jgi:hypothetical protein